MKVPNAERAIIAQDKLCAYLLNVDHRKGAAKARLLLAMGYRVDDHYAEQSNVTNAHKITGKLMLVVGELDRNVDPASTLQVVNALIKADRDFELLVVPGGGHGSAESPYGTRRRMDFFVRNLMGVEPRTK